MAEIRNVSGVGQSLPTLGLHLDPDGTVDVPAKVADELASRPDFVRVKSASKPANKAKES